MESGLNAPRGPSDRRRWANIGHLLTKKPTTWCLCEESVVMTVKAKNVPFSATKSLLHVPAYVCTCVQGAN